MLFNEKGTHWETSLRDIMRWTTPAWFSWPGSDWMQLSVTQVAYMSSDLLLQLPTTLVFPLWYAEKNEWCKDWTVLRGHLGQVCSVSSVRTCFAYVEQIHGSCTSATTLTSFQTQTDVYKVKELPVSYNAKWNFEAVYLSVLMFYIMSPLWLLWISWLLKCWTNNYIKFKYANSNQYKKQIHPFLLLLFKGWSSPKWCERERRKLRWSCFCLLSSGPQTSRVSWPNASQAAPWLTFLE